MGFLVIDELTDCWREGKKRNDYHSVFDSWVVKDIRAMVRRDRNHPCIILWSIGNEISEQLTAGGADLSSQLRALVRAQDPSRGITAGMNFVESGFNGFQHTVDVFGWNYKPMHYGQFIESNPGIPLYGSETSSCVSSRGEYFFPVSGRREDSLSGFQVSSYDIYYPHWATTPDVEFEHQDRHPSVAGEFVWTGFDYLGEPTPYNDDQANLLNAQNESDRKIIASEIDMNGRQPMPARSSYFGIVDLCGFRKDRFYLYQARWRPDLPMVHILPHWNWPERIGEVTPVHVYTAADEVELFLNGKSMGRKRRDTYSYRFRWDDVRYEPGELRAVSYKDGDLWAETVRRTTGPAFAIELVADRTSIQSDNDDVAFVTVRVVDKNGLLVPREKSLVKLEIEGPGKCIAVDNGDPSRLEPFFAQECRVFNGLALAVLKFQREPDGPFTLIARGEGLSEARLTISALSPIFQPDDPVCISG
jgi:beta-galactosidase